jgi:hypothetical protein
MHIKTFQFYGGLRPPGPPSYGMKVHKAYGIIGCLKIEMRTFKSGRAVSSFFCGRICNAVFVKNLWDVCNQYCVYI